MVDELTNTIDKIELHKTSVVLREDGIIRVEIQPNEEIDLIQVKKVIEAIEKIGKGKQFPILIILGENTLPNAEAREFVATAGSNPYAISEAYVIYSFTQKLVANVYIGFNKPARPTRFFNSEQQAVEWLKSFL